MGWLVLPSMLCCLAATVSVETAQNIAPSHHDAISSPPSMPKQVPVCTAAMYHQVRVLLAYLHHYGDTNEDGRVSVGELRRSLAPFVPGAPAAELARITKVGPGPLACVPARTVLSFCTSQLMLACMPPTAGISATAPHPAASHLVVHCVYRLIRRQCVASSLPAACWCCRASGTAGFVLAIRLGLPAAATAILISRLSSA